MPILQFEHAIKDFATWKAAFDRDPINRRGLGVRRHQVHRPLDDPNYVVGELEFDSEPDARHGRAVLVYAAHQWRSHTANAPVETGDHWITARGGPGITCGFTHVMLHRLLSLPGKTYRGCELAHLLGGVCTWDVGSRTETIRPFRDILCLLPLHARDRRHNVDVEAFVDPDPRFITHSALAIGPPPSGGSVVLTPGRAVMRAHEAG